MKDPWGDVAQPLLEDRTWEFEGVLPAGTSLSDVKQDRGNRVRCKVGGVLVYTADWNIE